MHADLKLSVSCVWMKLGQPRIQDPYLPYHIPSRTINPNNPFLKNNNITHTPNRTLLRATTLCNDLCSLTQKKCLCRAIYPQLPVCPGANVTLVIDALNQILLYSYATQHPSHSALKISHYRAGDGSVGPVFAVQASKRVQIPQYAPWRPRCACNPQHWELTDQVVYLNVEVQ